MIRSRDIDNGRFKFTGKQVILLLINYFVLYSFVYQLLGLAISAAIGHEIMPDMTSHPKVDMFINVWSLITMMWIVKEPLSASFNFVKKKTRETLTIILKNFAFLWLANIVVALILTYVFKMTSDAENQLIIEAMAKESPFLVGFLVVIFAPIVEELIFRGVLYQNLRSESSYKKAMVISILVFSMMHILPGLASGNGIKEMLYILQYGSLAFFMIRAFEETGSIWGAIGIHFLNNLVGFIAIMMMI